MNDLQKSFGVVYCATGDRFVKESMFAIESLRKLEPEINICVFTDLSGSELFKQQKYSNFFIELIEKPFYNWNDKIYSIEHSPFDRSAFMDSDTVAIRPISDHFYAALDHFEILCQEATGKFNLPWEGKDYSNCIAQFSSGVVLFKKCEKLNEFVITWKELKLSRNESEDYIKLGNKRFADSPPDQPTFREAILNSGIKYGPLRNEYNYHGSVFTTDEIFVLHFSTRFLHKLEPDKLDNLKKSFLEVDSASFFIEKERRFVMKNGAPDLMTLLKLLIKYTLYIPLLRLLNTSSLRRKN